MNKYYYENIYWRGTDLWIAFAGKKIFVAGGSGFYGKWFVGFLNFLKQDKEIPLEVEWGSRSTGWMINDCTTYTPFQYQADYIINCAGYSGTNFTHDEIVSQHVAGPITLASTLKKDAVMLQISSGAINHSGTGPNAAILKSYAGAKKASEWFLKDMGVNIRIVRPFATVGPGMGLDKHFAISTFMRNKLQDKPLEVSNRPIGRSFVHITDLLVQMFHVMMGNSKIPYEVGSDDKITMLEAAQVISDNIIIVDREFSTNAVDEYAADLTRIKNDFNLGLDFTSKSAILNTFNHYASDPAEISHSGIIV